MLSHFGIFYEVERKSGRSKPFYHYGVPPLDWDFVYVILIMTPVPFFRKCARGSKRATMYYERFVQFRF